MRPKVMEDLAAFSAREIARVPDSVPESRRYREQQQRKEKETSIPLRKDSESQSRRQNHPSELSES